MKAVGNYVVCILDRPDEVKTSVGIYLNTKNESDVYKVVSSGIPEVPDGSRILIDDTCKHFTIQGKDYVMVHKEYVFAIV